MTRNEIIDGLKFTIEMFLLDINTGKTFTEPRNDMDKITIDACKGAIKLLEQESTADVVEVVRCKDCKHRPIIIEEEEIDGFSYEFPDHKCPCRCEDGLFSSNPDDDWFCANGERG